MSSIWLNLQKTKHKTLTQEQHKINILCEYFYKVNFIVAVGNIYSSMCQDPLVDEWSLVKCFFKIYDLFKCIQNIATFSTNENCILSKV